VVLRSTACAPISPSRFRANFVLADQDPQLSVGFPEVFFIRSPGTFVSFGLGFCARPNASGSRIRRRTRPILPATRMMNPKRRLRAQSDGE